MRDRLSEVAHVERGAALQTHREVLSFAPGRPLIPSPVVVTRWLGIVIGVTPDETGHRTHLSGPPLWLSPACRR
jgi:hypothetical protein